MYIGKLIEIHIVLIKNNSYTSLKFFSMQSGLIIMIFFWKKNLKQISHLLTIKAFQCKTWDVLFEFKVFIVCVQANTCTCMHTHTISYPLFADADMGIYPHAASLYHARPKAKRGIAMLSVDKFPYPRKQTRGNEFIPCSNNICDILKRFRSFKIPAITLIWPKSSYKQCY